MAVVITGATGVIGGAIADGVTHDAKVTHMVLIGRDARRTEETAARLRSMRAGLTVEVELADLSDPGSVVAAAQNICSRIGVVDVLINAAANVPPERQDRRRRVVPSSCLDIYPVLRSKHHAV